MSRGFSMNREISQPGLELVKNFEGLYLEAYLDPADVWTIGYGHTGPEAFRGNAINRSRADVLLNEDMKAFSAHVERLVQVPLNPNQFDALVSFTFNVGAGALSRSTLLRLLNQGNYQGAASEFHKWNKATVKGVKQELRGLTRRRAAEANLFLTPMVPRQKLGDSRTLKAGKVAAGATLCSALVEGLRKLEPLDPLLTRILNHAPNLLLVFIALGVGFMLWARFDDHKRGLR